MKIWFVVFFVCLFFCELEGRAGGSIESSRTFVFKIKKKILCMSILPTCTSLYLMHTLCPQRPEKDNPLGLELLKVVICHVGARNQTVVL